MDSKFKVGDKVKMVVDESAGYPNHSLLIVTKSMMRRGQVGTVIRVTQSSGIRLYQVKNESGSFHYYDEDWLVKFEGNQPRRRLYKRNDKVRCIDTLYSKGLLLGAVYVIAEDEVVDERVVKLVGHDESVFLVNRFELANDKPLFKVGDRVRNVSTVWTYGVPVGDGLTIKDFVITEMGVVYTFHENPAELHEVWLELVPPSTPASKQLDDTNTSLLGEVNMSIDATVAVLNKTYIYGKDADTVTVDDVFNHIKNLEVEVAKYESIKNKPKAVKAKVDAIKAEIEQLVAFSDAKFAE